MARKYNKLTVNDLLNDDSSAKVTRTFSAHPSMFEMTCGIANCRRRFKSIEALQAHQEKAHSNDKDYVCPHCHSNFSTSPNLNKHVSTLKNFRTQKTYWVFFSQRRNKTYSNLLSQDGTNISFFLTCEPFLFISTVFNLFGGNRY